MRYPTKQKGTAIYGRTLKRKLLVGAIITQTLFLTAISAIILLAGIIF